MPRSDLDFETRVGKPWTRRIERWQFGSFLSKFPGRNGNERQEISRGTQGKRKNQRGKETRLDLETENRKRTNTNNQP
eukprot:scaffold579178_cov138-Attheya_sp.AAC.1